MSGLDMNAPASKTTRNPAPPGGLAWPAPARRRGTVPETGLVFASQLIAPTVLGSVPDVDYLAGNRGNEPFDPS